MTYEEMIKQKVIKPYGEEDGCGFYEFEDDDFALNLITDYGSDNDVKQHICTFYNLENWGSVRYDCMEFLEIKQDGTVDLMLIEFGANQLEALRLMLNKWAENRKNVSDF